MLALVLSAALLGQVADVPAPAAAPSAAAADARHPRYRKGVWIGLLAGGGGVIALTYVVSALDWLLNSRISYAFAYNEPPAWTFIPVVGAWISVADNPGNYTESTQRDWRTAMVISGVAQTVGLAAMVLGFVLKGQTLPGPDPEEAAEHPVVEFAVSPLLGPGMGGVSLGGRF